MNNLYHNTQAQYDSVRELVATTSAVAEVGTLNLVDHTHQ